MTTYITHPLKERLKNYALLMRMDKPIGSLLLLWPTLWALWLAGMQKNSAGEWVFEGVQPSVVLIFIAGVFLMRSAGCVINDFADRGIDKHVERTANRPLTSGAVKSSEAIALFAVLALLSFSLMWLIDSLQRWNVMLWSLPAVATAIAYPFMKRFFVTPQLVLGIAFSFGIPMAYAAYGHNWEVSLPIILLVLANVAWVVVYDTEYAMVDRNDDVELGVHSTALFFGMKDRLVIGILQLICLGILLLIGNWYSMNDIKCGVFLISTDIDKGSFKGKLL